MIHANISLVRATEEEGALACRLIDAMKKVVPDSLLIEVETAMLDRMDFTAGGKCDTCLEFVEAGPIYVFRTTTGSELACCPACRYRLADIDPAIANFTRGFALVNESPDGNDVGRMEEYLRLRYEKLAPAGFMIPPFRRLDEIYRRYSECGTLLYDDQAVLRQILSQLQGRFSQQSLQLCYAYLFYLNVALSRLPPGQTSFLGGVLRMLKTKLYLSRSQTQAVENWLTKLKLPTLPEFTNSPENGI